MDQIQNFGFFITLILILLATPGPDMLYVLTKGVSQGKQAGVVSGVGVGLGIFVHTIFAALGLSVILQTSATAFMVVKYLGAGYLIYLGIRTLMDRKSGIQIGQSKQLSNGRLFVNGLLSNVLNPKIALFFIAFLPQFVKPGATPLPFLILGIIFSLFTAIAYLSMGYFSGYIGGFLQKKQMVSIFIQKASGVIMVLLGIRLVFVRR